LGHRDQRGLGTARLIFATALALGFAAAASDAARAQSSTTTRTPTSSLNPSQYNQPVTFTATIAGNGNGAPTGTVQFMDGANALGGAVTVNTMGVGYPIAAGYFHTCALTAGGGVKCWGGNYFGQLGSSANTGTNNPNPTPIDTGLSGVVAIAAGDEHTCAVTAAGGVECWGGNYYGQLGSDTNSGTSTPNPTPLDTGLSGVVAIAAGRFHTCAVTAAGGVKCWGYNDYGQLGSSTNNGTEIANPTPIDTGLSGIVAIVAGTFHTCALTAAGGVKCWGYNYYGELGSSTNSVTNNANPTPIDTGLSGIVAIAAGSYHTCALTTAGGVKCWGHNHYGQLGSSTNNGTETANPTPLDTGLSGIVAIAAGAFHSCAPTAAGGVQCWGDNRYGQIGSSANNLTDNANPTPLAVTDFGAGAAQVYGNATLTTSALTGGNHSITAFYTGDMAHNASTSDLVSQDVDLAPSISSANHAAFAVDQPGNFVVTTTAYPVPALSESGALPSGVLFVDNGDGTATLTGTPGLGAVGSYTVMITASNGIAPDAPQSFTLLVGRPPAVTSASSTVGTVGSPFTFTVTSSGDPAPTLSESGALPGGVSFSDNGNGTATFSGTPGTGGGGSFPVTITASNGIAPGATQSFTFTIAKGTASVSLSPLPNPAKLGQSVALTASMSGPAAASGSVTFKDGTTTLGSGNVSGATAVLSASTLAVGRHSLTALFNANSDLNAATSSPQSLTVTKGDTTVVASASPATSKPGQAVTLKATVAATAPAAATPSGSVMFKDGGKTLGSGTIASSKAQTSTSSLTIGDHVITASYSGDGNLTGSSATTAVKVSAAVGSETKVNTTTAGTQQLPAVAALKSGYVIVWASQNEDKSGYGVYTQRYTSAGAKSGGETQVNTTKTGDQTMPAVAGLKSGGFIVVWQSGNEDKSGLGVYGQIFTAAGAKSGVEFKANTTTSGDQSLPSVASLASGGFVVAWTSNGQDGSGLGVYAQVYDATGKASGSEFKVNTVTAGDQSNPSVAGLTGGGFVIAWQGPDANGLGVYMQRYAATGRTAGTAMLVNKTTVNDQSLPSIAPLDNGGYVVAWQSALQDGSGLGIYTQHFTAAGSKTGNEVLVNTTTANDQSAPAASGFSDGGYVVLWQSKNQDGSGLGVYAQAFNDAGAKVNAEFLVNTTTAGDQSQPAVAAFASGNFVAAWTSANDGSSTGIYSQCFLVPGTH